MTDARALSRMVLLCAALVAMVGCAPPPAGEGAAPVPPAKGATGSTSASGASGHGAGAAAAMPDSSPSTDAVRVLATIPEPLTPSQQVPPPAGLGTVTARAPEAAYDTLRAGSTGGGDSSAVPVPAATQPLGTGAGGALTMPDTLTAPAVAATGAATAPPDGTAPAAGAAANPAAAAAAPAATGECWRVQVAAPDDRAMADSRSSAAQSLLLVPMAITYEKGLYKVRTQDCMARDAADALKQRAIESGFTGAFLVNTNAAAAPAAAKPKPKPKSGSTKHSPHSSGSTKPK